jgi:hypothetical protein
MFVRSFVNWVVCVICVCWFIFLFVYLLIGWLVCLLVSQSVGAGLFVYFC